MFQTSIFGGATTNYTEWAPGSGGQPLAAPSSSFDDMNSVLNLARPDGFGINSILQSGYGPEVPVLAELTFQGVRAYDSTTSQWASPDFYAGDVNDPGSQRPFMWNGNNPLQYSDPSGYLILSLPNLDFGATYRHIGAKLWNAAIGGDLRTATDSKASLGSRVLAVILLASNFIGPEKLLGETAAKLGIKTVEYSGKVLGQASREFGEFHSFNQSVDAAVLSHGTVDNASGDYVQMSLEGSYRKPDGTLVQGRFEIGGKLDKNGKLTVTHRFFNPN